jgi:ABC-type uncharacterized transport system substrate-binding protein
MRILLLALFFVTLSLGTVPAQSRDFPIRIVTADQSPATRAIIDVLLKQFPTASLAQANALQADRTKRGVYLAVGPAALRACSALEGEAHLISLFSTFSAYNEIVASFPPPRRRLTTAIYADPSPLDQLRLVQAIYNKPIEVAVILSEKTRDLASSLKGAAVKAGVEIVVDEFGEGDNLNRALNRVAKYPVLLAIPDASLYTSDTLRNVLITTYRHDQAVIGFSAVMVNAGALATTFSRIEDIASQVSEMLGELAASGPLPPEQFPKYFSAAINESVARSLNLVVDDRVKRLSNERPGRQR